MDVSDVDWTKPELYMETIIDGGVMKPREKLTAVPFSMHAESAESIKKASGNINFVINGSTCAKMSGSNGLEVIGDIKAQDVTVTGNLNVTGNINKAGFFVGVPAGTIVAYYGDKASIPSDWAICDGTNGTPDLRNMFIVGGVYNGGNAKENIKSDIETVGNYKNTGGNVTITHNHEITVEPHVLTSNEMPNHRHWYYPSTMSYSGGGVTNGLRGDGSGTTTLSTEVAGGSQAHSHGASCVTKETSTIPPYYTIVYIMKVRQQ